MRVVVNQPGSRFHRAGQIEKDVYEMAELCEQATSVHFFLTAPGALCIIVSAAIPEAIHLNEIQFAESAFRDEFFYSLYRRIVSVLLYSENLPVFLICGSNHPVAGIR